MKSKSLAQVIFSLILVAFLTITLVIISPQVAVAKSSSNTPLELLTSGLELQEQGDLVKATVSYQEAIDRVLTNKEIQIFIAAKQNLARIKESQGDIDEANKLYEEADTLINKLGLESILEFDSSCDNNCGRGYERKGFSRCRRCPIIINAV